MSLETKIEELTRAINLLRETILMDVRGELSPNEPLSSVEEPEKSSPVEELDLSDTTNSGEQVEVMDFDSFKAKCLDFARDPKVGKVKVKDVLKEFGAAKASDVADSDRAKVIGTLEAL